MWTGWGYSHKCRSRSGAGSWMFEKRDVECSGGGGQRGTEGVGPLYGGLREGL